MWGRAILFYSIEIFGLNYQLKSARCVVKYVLHCVLFIKNKRHKDIHGYMFNYHSYITLTHAIATYFYGAKYTSRSVSQLVIVTLLFNHSFMQSSERSTCNQPYLHPIRRTRSAAFSINGTRTGGACIGPEQAEYADNFPYLTLSSSSCSEKGTTTPAISSTVSFSQLISNKVDDICNDIDANVVSLPAGWIEITLNDVRTEQRNRQPKKSTLITHKDDFLRRIH